MQTYIVGGAVRDLLMGFEPKYIDYVVVGTNETDFLKNPPAGKSFTKVGEDFPVFLDEDGSEWALARKERKVGGGYVGFEFETDTASEVYKGFELKSLDNELMKKFVDAGFNTEYEYEVEELIKFFRSIDL